MEITITRALNQLTLLDKRISKTVEELKFVAGVKKTSDKVLVSQTREEFIEKQKAKYQSLQALIALRHEIKSKIVLSNASTVVTIADKEYTVAEAIEYKNSIIYEKKVLTHMKSRLANVMSTVNRYNEDVEEKAFDIVKTISGKDVKNIKLEDSDIAKQYLENNSYEIINPLDVETKISELDKHIDNFENTVDYVLSESNATTKILVSCNPDAL